MSFYTEVFFSANSVTLKSFEEKAAGQAILLNEQNILKEELESGLKKSAITFPKRIKITLEPEELLFKNIEVPFQDEKLLEKLILNESRKYFKTREDFVFSYYIWGKCPKNLSLTLLGVKQKDLEAYLPFIKMGFVPFFAIRDFLSDEKELFVSRVDRGFRIYYNGSLIGWKTCGKEDLKEVEQRVKEYVLSLGLPLPELKEKKAELFNEKSFSFMPASFLSVIQNSLKRLFWQIIAAVTALSFIIILVFANAQFSGRKQNLDRIEAEIKKFQEVHKMADLESIKKKSEIKVVPISTVLNSVNQYFPKGRKIYRFQLREGEAELTVLESDLLEVNKIKEALESEKNFYSFRIEEGGKTNEKRIVFQIKR
jgi:hypothetical protein